MTVAGLDVTIFSFNRADYLRHAVQSARVHLPGARIRVFDDNSTDPATLDYLATLGDAVVRSGSPGDSRHGGLYANMQRAFDSAQGRYLLMLQDDVQVVRPVDAQDMADIDRIFDSDPRCAFVSVLFLKGARMRRYRRMLAPLPERGVYDAPPGLPARLAGKRQAYFDVALWHLDRLRAAGWSVLPSEHGNVLRAHDLFSTMPVMRNPFVFYCPEVPFYRHRSQTWAARLAGHVLGRAVKGFHPMTAAQVAALRARPITVWPRAEDFLEPTDPAVRRPFVYKDVKARWWLYALHRAEQALRRPIQKLRQLSGS